MGVLNNGKDVLATDHTYTGQKVDGTGLMYYNARYYDPQLGLFVSPDSIIPDETNLFDYNRYMYVRGNPLRFNDPSGHEPCPSGNWGDCRPTLTVDELIRLRDNYGEGGYVFEGDVKAIYTAHGLDVNNYESGDFAETEGVQVQTGWKDPATLISSAFGGGRLVAAAPKLAASTATLCGGSNACTNIPNTLPKIQKFINQLWGKLAGNPDELVTMYRGTNDTNEQMIIMSGRFLSHARRANIAPNVVNQSFIGRLRHINTSKIPPSQYVSLTADPIVAKRFGQVFEFEVRRGDIYRSWLSIFGEAEYLIHGSGQAYNPRIH